jgi:hypothetical protein
MLTELIKSSFKDAAKKLTGYQKRAFMAQVTKDYFNGSPRKAETQLGWGRQAVATGLKELETGFICVDNYQARGRKATEKNLTSLREDIERLLANQSSTDPKFRSIFRYARISARAVRKALIEEKGYQEEELPGRQTIGEILNRMGYRLKKHKKRNPSKKFQKPRQFLPT